MDRRTFLAATLGSAAVRALAHAQAPPQQISPVPTPRDWSRLEPIAYPDPDIGNASGIHFVGVMKRLGIDEKIRPKLVVWKTPFPEFARTSEAQLAITQAMDILVSPRYELKPEYPSTG